MRAQPWLLLEMCFTWKDVADHTEDVAVQGWCSQLCFAGYFLYFLSHPGQVTSASHLFLFSVDPDKTSSLWGQL